MEKAKEPQATPRAIPAHEQAALARRRSSNGIDQASPAIGLALSGGGVRSATFCLGLLRALAKNGVLHRFDYLSTVSGGGYVGAAFGRLFNAQVTPKEVEDGIANDRSVLLWWLRSNSRYLLPGGFGDLIQTWAGQLRGFVATQFEVIVLMALASCVIVLPHLAGFGEAMDAAPWLSASLWWAVTPLVGWLAILMAFAYWWSGDREDRTLWKELAIAAIATLIAASLLEVVAHDSYPGRDGTMMALIGVILLAVPVAWIVARPGATHPAQVRVRFTIRLASMMKALIGLFLLGAADLSSWFIAGQVRSATLGGSVLTGAGLVTMLVAVARIALPILQSHANKKSLAHLPLALMADLCGMILVVLLVMFWLSALQFFVFFASVSPSETWMHWAFAWLPASDRVAVLDPWLRWLTVFSPCVLFATLTGANLQQLNRSSLHPFYRSRIARTYVAVGNSPVPGGSDTKTRFPVSPLATRGPGVAASVKKLTELMAGDDIPLPDYHPHTFGGPIHLINCCINQTVDDRTQAYSADRKGVYLTVSDLGVETGSALPSAPDHATNGLGGTTLAEWIAISGAAAGSGMGSLTRTGTAAMFFLSGLRLGYWWRNGQRAAGLCWSCLAKSVAAMHELLARFPGLSSPVWYLSDGGHFDNTGLYSLLKRRLRLIVLADCGADPNYVFDDLEGLIRKARIDMDTDIAFIDPASLQDHLEVSLCERFGTPDSIMPGPGRQSLLLGRISYSDGSSGCLLVLKPRMSGELPLDVAGYADRHGDFPQQSTSNQFFDEAQWESYCQLGNVLGAPIDHTLLGLLPQLVAHGTAVRSCALSDVDQKISLTRRQRFGTTLGASLSFGALATVAATGWQTWQNYLSQFDGSVQVQQATERDVDSLRTDLVAGVPYDRSMHGRIFALTQKFDQVKGSPVMVKALNDLAEYLNPVCGQLAPGSALSDPCLKDYFALHGAGATPSRWQLAMTAYRKSTPATLWSAIGDFALADVAKPPEPEMKLTAAAPAAAPQSAPTETMASAADTTAAAPPPPATATSAASANAFTLAGALVAVRSAPSSAPIGKPASDASITAACIAGSKNGTSPYKLYIQIYDEDQRPVAVELEGQFAGFGLRIPRIENVTQTALQTGREVPRAWNRPVFLYSSYNTSAQTCARALADWLASQEPFRATNPAALPLPIRLRGNPDAIELWLPASGKRLKP